MTAPRVAVVGAGIVGLAAATELVWTGAEVRLYEKTAPATAQSQGLTRIFRHAHGNPRLVELAVRSGRLWRAWEERFRRRLVGNEGLIVVGEEIVPTWERAMAEIQVPYCLLTAEECRRFFPLCQPPAGPALFDPGAGATRVRRTVDLLVQEVGARLRRAEVLAIEPSETDCVVRTADDAWTCDEVLITAGTETNTLARPLDLDVPTTRVHISRFTFAVRPLFQDRGIRLRCWIDDGSALGADCHAYGSAVGSTGRYAVGVSWKDKSTEMDPDAVSVESRRRVVRYVGEALPGLDPEPVSELRCTFPDCAFSADGDGFLARRRDHVTAIHGDNLFKFAPLLGALLRDTALTGTLSPELSILAGTWSRSA